MGTLQKKLLLVLAVSENRVLSGSEQKKHGHFHFKCVSANLGELEKHFTNLKIPFIQVTFVCSEI